MIDDFNAFSHFDPAAKSGEGPLAGYSIGVKANIAVAGMPFHAGLQAYRERIADEDADVIVALRNAGAKIVGILNMEEGALGSKTDNPFYGAVQNPHRSGYSPGGSSGGSGAAVAAGLCDAALGTDTMGSVRIPASHCGVYGFKPATARVSQRGLEPADLSLDAIGPLARNLDLLQQVSWEISDMGSGVGDYAGAVLVEHGVDLHPDVAAVFHHVLSLLKQEPAKVKLKHPNSRIRFAGFTGVADAMSSHLAGVSGLSENLQKLLSYGPGRPEEKKAEDAHVLAATSVHLRAVIVEHGFVIMPTVPNPPFPHSQFEPAAQADFTCLGNIAGVPALTLPAGWTQDGLPIGVQLLSYPGFEAGLFAMARFLDHRLQAYRPPRS